MEMEKTMETKPFLNCPKDCENFPSCANTEGCLERIEEEDKKIEANLQDFANALRGDPSLLIKLKKQEGLSEFREKYHVERATPLRCPTCNQFNVSGGTLWKDPDDSTRFVCRKCHIEYYITSKPPLTEIIEHLRKISKEGTSIFKITEE